MMRALCWLSMLFLFHNSEERNCSVSSITIEYIVSCPQNLEEWQAREQIKNCEAVNQHCTEKEYFKYHCVRNAFMNSTVEVCAPSWYSSGFCIEFNEGGERIQDNYDISCLNFTTPCPRSYISTDIYKYPECYSTTNKTGNSSWDSNNNSSATNMYNLPTFVYILIIVAVIIVILPAAAISIFFYLRNKKKYHLDDAFGFKNNVKPPKIVRNGTSQPREDGTDCRSKASVEKNGCIYFISPLCDDQKSLPSVSSTWELNYESSA